MENLNPTGISIAVSRKLYLENDEFKAVPIGAFRKMLIGSFSRLKQLLEGVPKYFNEVP